VRRLAIIAPAAGVLLLVATGCGDDPPSRADVMGSIAGDVAVPGFEEFAAAAAELNEHVGSACASPDETSIDEALEQVETTRAQWLSTQATWTGPVMERRSPAVVDWPIRVADIEAFIERSAPGEITAEVVGNNVGADTRGLTAMRWVLESDDVTEGLRDDVAERLGDERWCDYLAASAEVIATEADFIVSDWSESFDGGDAFSAVIAGDADADGWLEMMVNDGIFLVHKLTEEPRDEGDLPPLVVTADRAAQLRGIAEVYDELEPLLGDDLAERLDGELEAAEEAFASGELDRGRELAADVEATLATEVAARLDITIGFSDADGDSAG
jgi:predicted lipoprotein